MEFAQLKPLRGFDPIHSFMYYSQRIVTQPTLRRCVVGALRKHIRASQGAPAISEALTAADQASLRQLNESGYAPLQGLLSERQIAEIHAFMRDKRLKDRVHGGRVFTIDSVPDDARIGDYALKDMVDCPHILELANSPSLLRLAARYIGCKPTLSALGMRWSFPGPESGSILQAFHRDSDDWRFFKVFIYLTDVDDGSGPHVYVRGSHLTKQPIRLHKYSDALVERMHGADSMISVTGKAGFSFAADTSGIHKGMAPQRHARCLLQFQYSLLPTYAYRYRPVPYNGPLSLDRYVNRLIVQYP